jgi:hypothetical protein
VQACSAAYFYTSLLQIILITAIEVPSSRSSEHTTLHSKYNLGRSCNLLISKCWGTMSLIARAPTNRAGGDPWPDARLHTVRINTQYYFTVRPRSPTSNLLQFPDSLPMTLTIYSFANVASYPEFTRHLYELRTNRPHDSYDYLPPLMSSRRLITGCLG